MNYKKFYSFFLERYSGSNNLRRIWYHGTSSVFLKSILKNGLKADTKKKVWDKDEDSSFDSIDKTSYGGIYLTTNLGTASISSFTAKEKFGGEKIIVITELQTKTLVSDEDDFLSFHKINITNASRFYFLLKNGFENIQQKREYIIKRNEWITQKLNYILLDIPDIKPPLIKKIKELLKDVGWFSVIQRATAYVPEYSFDSESKEYPSKQKGENDYRNFIDQLTKLLKLYPRRNHFRVTGRSLNDITFSGKNKIVAIVQMVENDKNQNFRTDLILLYGSLPEKFIKDFKEKYNPSMNVIDGRKK